MEFQDQTRVCTDCGHSYVWRERDQRFAATQGWLPPKRCPPCRELRKQQQSRALASQQSE
jgi:hypothetical protein